MTPERILYAVAEYYGVNASELRLRKRPHYARRARIVAMHLCARLTKRSLSDLGRVFQCHHTTVLYARDRVAFDMSHDSELWCSVEVLRDRLSQEVGNG